MVIPPNRPSRRDDQLDRVYKTTREKYEAAIKDIRECYERGQPVLVGTTSIENSEIIDQLLNKEDLPHQVLNAKQHAREADIVAQAGRPKMITIATNMAGRGTDIVLGGNVEKAVEAVEADETLDAGAKQSRIAQLREQWAKDHEIVVAQGGLRIIATERHESRRIDNQLRGRSGRQGDPGSSRFYLSLDDPLMRIFAGDRVKAIMERLKMPDGEAIEAGIVTRSIESAQRKVEARNFDIRKQLLEYDDVANDQRKVIYQQRNDILDAADLSAQIASLREGCFTDLVHQYVPAEIRRGAMGHPGAGEGAGRRVGHRPAVARGSAGRQQHHRRGLAGEGRRGGQRRRSTSRCSRWARRTSRSSSASCCCRASTRIGASTCRRSTTCARASTCAAMRRSSPSRNTSARPSSCSASCWIRSRTKSPRCS